MLFPLSSASRLKGQCGCRPSGRRALHLSGLLLCWSPCQLQEMVRLGLALPLEERVWCEESHPGREDREAATGRKQSRDRAGGGTDLESKTAERWTGQGWWLRSLSLSNCSKICCCCSYNCPSSGSTEKPQGEWQDRKEKTASYVSELVPTRGNEQTGCALPEGCEWCYRELSGCSCVKAWDKDK